MEIYTVRRAMGTNVKVDTRRRKNKKKLEKLQIIINIIQSILERFLW